ncbi:AAA family ATPase [Kribbella catacumbae]|uniref:AAA family ATPase n=1 Tax=Kribbella catacumbae TaxID=460086 RepID=UPI003B500B72
MVAGRPTGFVGRADELASICPTLGRSDALSSRVVLINGIAGVGKTALALTAAHRLRADYPDGQLYADLRGSDAPLQGAWPFSPRARSPQPADRHRRIGSGRAAPQ